VAEEEKTEASIPVDLFNPGQVFACIGLMEAADTLCGDAEACFDWSDSAGVRFRLRASGPESPVERVLAFLDGATARAVAVEGSPNSSKWTSAWGDPPVIVSRGDGYPFPDPNSPATLVCMLSNRSDRLVIDYWGDATDRDNAKFWGGSGGKPGASLARDALALVKGRASTAASDPFSLSAPQSSSFRLDWRRDYVPLDAGFSLNRHKRIIVPLGFPLVELLGAIGLGHARPLRPNWRDRLTYEYAVIGRDGSSDRIWLAPSLVRAALGTSPLPLPARRFRMRLDSPGEEGQARAITTVTEETTS
jgi:CRISPR-associated protein Csx14